MLSITGLNIKALGMPSSAGAGSGAEYISFRRLKTKRGQASQGKRTTTNPQIKLRVVEWRGIDGSEADYVGSGKIATLHNKMFHCAVPGKATTSVKATT